MGSTLFAQETALEELVHVKKMDGTVFVEYENLVKTVSRKKKQELAKDVPEKIKDYNILSVNAAVQQAIVETRPEAIYLSLPKEDGTIYELELVQVEIFSPEFTLKEMPSGRILENGRYGVHYQGVVSGEKRSIATMSFFEDNIMGLLFLQGGRNIVFGKIETKTAYILYDDMQIDPLKKFQCGTNDDDFEIEDKQSDTTTDEDLSKSNNRCLGLHIDIGNAVVVDKGGTSQASGFLYSIFNQVKALYANEHIPVKITGVVAWTTVEPFKRQAGDNGLDQNLSRYRIYRSSNAWTGSVSQHMHYDGHGGVAHLNSLCNKKYSYGTNGIESAYQNVPTYTWNTYVIAHELGHNVASPHTHACKWNGNNTAIDSCQPSGCYATTPLPTKGTIMSYCHASPVANPPGIDFSLGFGPQPGSLMRSRYAAARACYFACGNDGGGGGGGGGCTTTVQCEYLQGGTWTSGNCNVTACAGENITLSILPNNLSQNWTGPNGFSASGDAVLNGITPAQSGSYTVTASDNNGCTYTKVIRVSVGGPSLTCEYLQGGTWYSGNCNVTACTGENITLSTLPNGLSQSWTGPNGFSASGDAVLNGISPAQSGTYNVTVTDANGCWRTGSMNVNVGGPSLTCEYLQGGTWYSGDCNVSACAGENITLSTLPNGLSQTWTWPNGYVSSGDIQLNNISPSQAGYYNVTVTDANGCWRSGSMYVGVSGTAIKCEHNRNGTWYSGYCNLRVCAGDNIVLSTLPNGLSQTWTWPNGGVSYGDIIINNIHGGTTVIIP